MPLSTLNPTANHKEIPQGIKVPPPPAPPPTGSGILDVATRDGGWAGGS